MPDGDGFRLYLSWRWSQRCSATCAADGQVSTLGPTRAGAWYPIRRICVSQTQHGDHVVTPAARLSAEADVVAAELRLPRLTRDGRAPGPPPSWPPTWSWHRH